MVGRDLFAVAIFRVAFGRIMVMKMKEPLQKEHCQEAAEHPRHRAVQRMQLFSGIRQEMQQCDPEHKASHEADGDLEEPVSWTHD